jgi:hypothetical protein
MWLLLVSYLFPTEELDSFNVYEKIDDQRFKQVVHFLSGSSTKQLMLRALDSVYFVIVNCFVEKSTKMYICAFKFVYM